MRSPSSRVLINVVNIFRSLSGPDAEGGVQYQYAGIPTNSNVQCTVQPAGVSEVVDGQNRVTQLNNWVVMFSLPQMASPRDKIVWVDALGVTRNLIIEATTDEAGRGSAFNFLAVERQ